MTRIDNRNLFLMLENIRKPWLYGKVDNMELEQAKWKSDILMALSRSNVSIPGFNPAYLKLANKGYFLLEGTVPGLSGKNIIEVKKEYHVYKTSGWRE